MATKTTKSKDEMTPEERSEEMRRRILLRWQKADPNRNKPGRDAIELVRLACEVGATKKRICQVLDISESKFDRFLQEPAFAAAVKGGRQYEHDALVNKLTELALKGNVSALIFSLKARHNYNDSGNGTATMVENKIAITFQLPDALPPEKYLQTLTARAQIIKPGDAARVLAQPGVKRDVMKRLAVEANQDAE